VAGTKDKTGSRKGANKKGDSPLFPKDKTGSRKGAKAQSNTLLRLSPGKGVSTLCSFINNKNE
jgi:hypothetical protein